jgi:hypothetical protein
MLNLLGASEMRLSAPRSHHKFYSIGSAAPWPNFATYFGFFTVFGGRTGTVSAFHDEAVGRASLEAIG